MVVKKTKKTAAKSASRKKTAGKPGDLVEMAKGLETIAVHPTCVSAHLRMDWVLVK